MNVTTIHSVREEHLKKVIADMRIMGEPTIKVAETCNGYIALEGTHRLEAAHRLELVPEFEIMDMDETMVHDFDIIDPECTVEEIVDYIGVPEGSYYKF